MQQLGRVFGGRFRTTTLLKEGQGVATFLARDLVLGTDVVVKATPAAELPAGAELRLAHEAEVLASVKGRSLTPLLAFGREEGLIYLALPFVPGRTLGQQLDRAPLTPRETVAVGIAIAEALQQVHALGVLHRDVKPDNVVVSDGRPITSATLIDFGLARSARVETAGPERLIGTARFMSPEQAGLLPRGVDERSDLYALGLVLHTCLAGRPPFDGRTIGEVLRQQLTAEAPDLRAAGVRVPRALEELIRRLLRKEPRERYQSASALLADLEELARALDAGVDEPPLVVGGHDAERAVTEPAFLGREREVAKVLDVIEAARAGDGGLVLVEAPSGAGKTWLLDEVARRAGQCWVLRGQGVAASAVRPVELLEGVVRDVVTAAQEDAALAASVRARVGHHGGSIAATLSHSRAVFGPVSVGALGPEAHAEHRVLPALAAFVAALGTAERPAVLLLDDAQWADETALKLLARLAEAPGALHVAVVVAFRSEEVPAEHLLRALPGTARLSLGPFDEAAIAALVESMAGPVSPEVIALVARLSEGNPFMAGAVLQGLLEAGALARGDDGWRLEPGTVDELQPSRRAAVLLARRLERLPPDALRLVTVGAVLGKSFLLERAAALAGLSAPVAMAAIEEARRRHIVWRDGAGVRATFVHDKLRESLLARLQPDQRRALHRAAAVELEARAADGPFELAYHYDAAGESQRALPHALAAAAEARSRHALEVAEAQYRIAERGAGDDAGVRQTIAEGLGDVLMLRGRYEEAAMALERARSLAQRVQDQARVEGKRGELAFKRGDFPRAIAALEGALALLGAPVPRRALAVLAACVREIVVQALHTLLPRLFVRRRRRGDREADHLACRVYSRLAYVYWFQRGKVPCFWAHLREMNLAERHGPSPELAQAYSEHAPAMTLVPWFRRGLDYAEMSLAIRRGLGDVWGQGQSLHFVGVLLYSSARLREARDRCREAMRLLARTGDRWEANDAALNAALALLRMGALREALKLARETHASAAAIGDTHSTGVSLEVWAKASGGRVPADLVAAELARPRDDAQTYTQAMQAEAVRLLHGQGDAAQAVAVLEEARALVTARGLRNEYVVSIHPWLATALRTLWEKTSPYAAAERQAILRRARAAARRAVREARRYPNNLPHALRELALIEAARGVGHRARALLDESVAIADRQEMRHEHAQSLLARARVVEALGGDGAADLAAGSSLLAATEAGVRASSATPPPDVPATVSLVDRFGAVLAAGRRIATALTERDVYAAVEDAARTLLHGQRCVVVAVGEGQPAGALVGDERAPISRTLLQRAIGVGRPLAQTESASDDPGESLVAADVRSALCAPILVRGRTVACLYVTHGHLARLFGDEDERIASFIATAAGAALENATNFSEVRALSDERARLYQGAQEALERRDEFLSIAAHELRTPMTALQLRVDSLHKEVGRGGPIDPGRFRQKVDGVGRIIGRLGQLVDTLLDVSRVVGGKMDLVVEDVDLAAVVRDAAARLEDELLRAGCTIELRSPVTLNGRWDRTRIDQAVTNLLTNAIKYGAGKPVEVAVETDGDNARVVVRDHGIGIAPEDQGRIFDRFERAVSSRNYGGLGLGLWIVRTIVESQGGNVRVASKMGEGATFTIELPRAGAPVPTAGVA